MPDISHAIISFLIFLLILGIIVVIIAVIVHFISSPTGPTGNTGPSGPSGNTGSNCTGNGAIKELCLFSGLNIQLINNGIGTPMGICQVNALNGDSNYCVDVGQLNFVTASQNTSSDSTTWVITQSTDGNSIALQNTFTGQYLTTDQYWESCVPCDLNTYGFACNNPVTTNTMTLDANNPNSNPDYWFSVFPIDYATFAIQLAPLSAGTRGPPTLAYLGTDTGQYEMNSASCPTMVVASYPQGNANATWLINYIS